MKPEDITRVYPEGTERTFDTQNIRIKLECFYEGCEETISGVEGYNGRFYSDEGYIADLRDQIYLCEKHKGMV